MEPSDFAALFSRFGQSVTLIHKTDGSFNIGTQTGAAPSESSEAATGIVRSYEQRLIDGQVVQPNDRKCLLDPTGLASAPDTTDEITLSGSRFQIVRVRTFAPAGTVIAYDCQLRGISA